MVSPEHIFWSSKRNSSTKEILLKQIVCKFVDPPVEPVKPKNTFELPPNTVLIMSFE